jgi:type II secretory pathway component PulJ
MVECLLGLAISAILLTAIAVAFNAATINYRENEEMFRSLNNARQALTRMTSQLRTGDTVDPVAPSNQCSFFTAANEDVTYDWRSDEQKLYVRMNNTGQEYVLCDKVVAASFSKVLTDDGLDCKAVQISLAVQSGRSVRNLAAAAAIRRNL